MTNWNIGVIGFGNIAQALIGGLLKVQAIDPDKVHVCAAHYDKLCRNAEKFQVHPYQTVEEVIKKSDVVILAVKPYQMEKVVLPIKGLLKDKVVVSVASGWMFDRFETILEANTHHITISPNTPTAVAEGIIIVQDKHSLTDFEFELLIELLEKTALVEVLDAEHMSIAGTLSGATPAYAAMFIEEGTPKLKDTKWIPVRTFFAINESISPYVAHGLSLLNWRSQVRFCSSCGTPLYDHKSETARYCIQCNKNFYPPVSPCVIVRITKDDKILLARHSHRNTDVFTCLAGYVEPGETLEECVEREVFEETGIKVKNIEYLGSQSWPFPDQLMVAFKAEYAGGEQKLQPEEISEIAWFTKDNLPPIPKKGSIAYKLITEY